MTLHLIQAPLDMRTFSRWAGTRGLMRRGAFDAGYAFHILLSAMFGKGVLQPFRVFASERRASAALYGYADVDVTELRYITEAVAPPDCLDVLDPESMRSKRIAVALRTSAAARLRSPASACAAAAPRSCRRAAWPFVVQGCGGGRLPGRGDPQVPLRMDRFR